MTDFICSEAKTNLFAVQDLPVPDALKPSSLWIDYFQQFLQPQIENLQSNEEVIAFINGYNAFNVPRSKQDPIAYSVVMCYLEWLKTIGSPIESFGILVQDSAYAPEDTTLTIDGRRLSALFLWYLCTAHTLLSKAQDITVVAEIGAGFGALARVIKLLRPSARYLLIDLPQSLFFSYVYLRRNFPNARCRYVSNPAMLTSLGDDYDFCFIPVCFLDDVKGLRVDATVSTAALAEMTQAAANRYMSFIQNDIDTRYFFSLNRYGHHRHHDVTPARSGRVAALDCCSVAVHLDQHWQIRWWDLHGEKGFSQLDPIQPPHLELLVERIPIPLRDNDSYIAMSQGFYDAVSQSSNFGSREHQLLWDSVRLWPTAANLSLYLKFLHEKNYVERHFYLGLLQAVDRGAADAFQAKGITSLKADHGMRSVPALS